MKMMALSIKQPWAWLIVNGYKDVENRTWKTAFRGRFLVHASKTMTRGDYEACRIFIAGFTDIQLPPAGDLLRGGIVGVATLWDCFECDPMNTPQVFMENPWFNGRYGFALNNPEAFCIFECPGALHFFKVEIPDKWSCMPGYCELFKRGIG